MTHSSIASQTQADILVHGQIGTFRISTLLQHLHNSISYACNIHLQGVLRAKVPSEVS